MALKLIGASVGAELFVVARVITREKNLPAAQYIKHPCLPCLEAFRLALLTRACETTESTD